MENKTKIKTHPALLHADDLKAICKPLNHLSNIDYFSHVKMDNKGNFTGLGTNPAFVKHYLSKDYFNCDSHLQKLDGKIEFILQDSVTHFGKTKQLFHDCKAFNVHHVFTILHRDHDSINAYHFATSNPDNPINEFYLKNIIILKNFISYFNESMKNAKALNQAYQIKFALNQDATYESGMEYARDNIDIKRLLQETRSKRLHLLDEYQAYITERELECLLYLHLGKTADEIATILNIAERTVRAHINSLKQKLHCKTLFQLGEKAASCSITQLFDLYQFSYT